MLDHRVQLVNKDHLVHRVLWDHKVHKDSKVFLDPEVCQVTGDQLDLKEM